MPAQADRKRMEGMFVDPTPPISELVLLLLLLLTLVLTFVKICLELFVNVLMLVPVSAMLEPKNYCGAGG